jgi:hypothetical protein
MSRHKIDDTRRIGARLFFDRQELRAVPTAIEAVAELLARDEALRIAEDEDAAMLTATERDALLTLIGAGAARLYHIVARALGEVDSDAD